MSNQINIGGRIHSTEVGNVSVGANEVLDDTKGKKQNVINSETDAELLRLDQSKQNNLTFDNAPTEDSNNPVKSSGVYAADKALSDAIEAILLLIPSAATALNQLADKAFVNSSVSTATATFRGTYNVVTDLELAYDATHEQIATKLGQVIATADNNDYAFVQVPVSATSTDIRRTERYKFNGTVWGYEYDLNTSGFTAVQWEAINSGITALLVSKLTNLPTAEVIAMMFAAKQDVLTFDNAPSQGSDNPVKSEGIYEAIKSVADDLDAVEGVIPSAATAQNKLADKTWVGYAISEIINALDATFNISSADGHVTVSVTQIDGKITAVGVTTNDIASASTISLLGGRVTVNENAISSLGNRMTTAEGNISTNAADIANLQQLYNNLQQSKPVPVTALPSSGQQQGVIYRLAGTTSYSDYMWNGSTWVLMATYNNAIDDAPTAGSDNLVKSGGVYNALLPESRLQRHVLSLCELEVGGLNDGTGGNTSATTRCRTKGFIDAPFKLTLNSGYNITFVCKYTQDKNGNITFDSTEYMAPVTVFESTDRNYLYRIPIEKDGGADFSDTDLPNVISSFKGVSEIDAEADESKMEIINGKIDGNICKTIGDFSKLENNSIVSSTGNIGVDGRFDIYILKNNNFKYIKAKVAASANSTVAIAFYSGEDIAASDYMADKSVVMNGTIDTFQTEVPSNCKIIVVTNMKTMLANPEISVYQSVETSQSSLEEYKKRVNLSFNPYKNCFLPENTIANKRIIVSGSTWSIVDSPKSRIVIIPVFDWANVSIKIPAKRKQSTDMIFLDKDMNPLYNGGSYNLPADNPNVSFGLSSVPVYGLYYLAFDLYLHVDFGNKNAANGYVWSDREIAQGYPDWIEDVIVNFTNDTTRLIKEREYVIGDSYRIGKNYEDSRASADFCKHVIKRGTRNKMFNMFFATDSHIDFNRASTDNVKDMVDLANREYILPFVDCIIHDGDVATPSYIYTKQQAINDYLRYYDIVKGSVPDFIQVCGNHDKHQEKNVLVVDALTNADVVAYYQEYTKHTAETLYEYRDYADKKIRIIKLDAFDYPLEDDGSGKVKYPLTNFDPFIGQTQLNWFVSALASTPEDYSIIVAGHLYIRDDMSLLNVLSRLMEARRNKENVSLTVTYPTGYPVESMEVSADFTGSDTCYPAIILCGHSHKDQYMVINNIHVLNTCCQLMDNDPGQIYPGRVANTPNQNLFNMMSFDFVDHRIYVTRYGFLGDPDFISEVTPTFETYGFLTY